MLPTILSLVLTSQVVNGNNECCQSKTVGDFSYSLLEVSATVPKNCLKSCAYSRDGEDGSRYCFAAGNLEANCIGENPVNLNQCYPDSNGNPSGCPPDDNLKIVDADPFTTVLRTDEQECLDYCRYLCKEEPCQCSAWTFQKSDKTCYTYYNKDGPPCFKTAKEDGFVSGGVCFDSNDDSIKLFTEEGVSFTNPFFSKFQGYLADAYIPFNSSEFAVDAEVAEIIVYTGYWAGLTDVIVGIQAKYTTESFTPVYGRRGTKNATFPLDIAGGQFVVGVNGRSNNQAEGAHSLVYQLAFSTTSAPQPLGPVGRADIGTTFETPSFLITQSFRLFSFEGFKTKRGTLGRLRFGFRKI